MDESLFDLPPIAPISDDEMAERVTYEVFETPLWAVSDAVNWFAPMVAKPRTKQLRCLEIGANDGRWSMAVRQHFPDAHVTGIEVRFLLKPPPFDAWIIDDFMARNFGRQRFDLIYSNPPFSKMLHMVLKSYDLLADQGLACFYNRNAFAHGWQRYRLLHSQIPMYCEGVFVPRPSHIHQGQKKGRTDKGQEYSMFVWRKGFTGTTRKLWIPPTIAEQASFYSVRDKTS